MHMTCISGLFIQLSDSPSLRSLVLPRCAFLSVSVHALSTCGSSWIVYSHCDFLLPALDSQLLVADFYFIAACPVLMPVLGFRVVLPLLLCLLVIDLVCSSMFSINLQINPQSVEVLLHQESINAYGILVLTFYYIHICFMFIM